MRGADCGRVRPGGADQDTAGKPVTVFGQVQAGDERAHRVTKQKIGEIGITLLHQVSQMLYILHEVFPAVTCCEKAQLRSAGNGSPMANMVIAADNEA